MYDEVLQLLAVVKNDAIYFERIEDLKKKQMELAHIEEIASTLKEAEGHVVQAKQKAQAIVEEAQKNAEITTAKAALYVSQKKDEAERAKHRAEEVKDKLKDLADKEAELNKKQAEAEAIIQEHRKLTVKLSEEIKDTQLYRQKYESKVRAIQDFINS